MKTLFIIPLILMSLVSFPSWGLSMDDLVYRAGLFYEKFTATPFTGEVDKGLSKGSIKNGNMVGHWVNYWSNGQLKSKGDYKNGNADGFWEYYNPNGSVWKGWTGTYKNGVKLSD